MHNIKEGHGIKAFVGDMFMNFAEAFKKTKTAQAKNKIKSISQIRNARKKKLPDPIIFACLFILMGDVLQLLKPIISKCTFVNIKEGHDIKVSVADSFCQRHVRELC
jgi:hypothetical protein